MATPPIGRRQTQQRDVIQAVIHAAPGPLSVPEIHESATDTLPSLGVATVYRAVKLLQETGRIHTVTLPGDSPRYEAADLGHHHHFHCLACDRVYDLPGCLVPIPAGTSLPGGFTVTGHEVTLSGTCSSCGVGAAAPASDGEGGS